MFKKVKNNQYIFNGDKDAIYNKINEIIEDISVVGKSKYNDTINDILYENLLSRYISGLFIEQHSEELDGTHHILVNISINDENYSITIGSFDLDNDVKYLNGIVMT